ncbi:MAG: MlaD family protein [Mucilaginibacter sp.]
MANQEGNHIKLGIFVISGLAVLILAFYLVGKNHNLFGNNIKLKARFSNLAGLQKGDNVLYAGIQAGTVSDMVFSNDSTIEVSMLIDSKVSTYIRRNALASIGTEGLMGNKVINITPRAGKSDNIKPGDILNIRRPVSTDQMMETLSRTNDNIADISGDLKTTVKRLNNSALWDLLTDKKIAGSLKTTLFNLEHVTGNANKLSQNLNRVVKDLRQGKGAVGKVLSDTTLAVNLQQAVRNIRLDGEIIGRLGTRLDTVVNDLNSQLQGRKGVIHTLLRDSLAAANLSKSLDNIQKGTAAFNQDMEALKHNFLLRGYFKKLEKEQKKTAATPTDPK